MITVRSPHGVCVQYNAADYVVRSGTGGYTDLYERKDGAWVAQVGNGWLIEVQTPCRVYRAAESHHEGIKAALPALRARPTGYTVACDIAELKRELEHFDARRRRWK
jgi:hypothetical protein